ncbi:beta-galactosidase 14 [Beta vulgaris subsp. vulgaris]|uniref:beta-galactosidase 14 n=1 Tax=Beta vulgaris subsp. vulgaris TaxID=3555 RepID=UPI002036BCDD|nr:beta-galactosidase 14 [Beta vulgaris subsp. vulgaris]
MWEDLLDKAKEGGLNAIQTYVFWNVHEPTKGQYNFTDSNDLVKFIKLVGEKGMWAILRVGPFIQAEWNHGGLPYWLREEPNITYRTDNPAYKVNMERWVTKVVNLMRDNKLYAPQGGPIIMSQIENEYDHVRDAFNDAAERYIKWAGTMAVGLKTDVPWIMCKSKDAPSEVINACNGRHCGDTFKGPNTPGKPSLWTENWTAQYRVFGDAPSQRAAEDIAFSVARWFGKNGSHVNYYMYYGGTNYGRTAASFVTTRYYDEAPIDEFGLVRDPKWGHLKHLHQAILLAKKPILEGTYRIQKNGADFEANFYEKGDLCAAFLWNNHTHETKTMRFRGKEHQVPPRSISILPDCKTLVYNTDYMVSQHSAREFVRSEKAHANLKWEKTTETLPGPGKGIFSREPKEQYVTTKDQSDYLWYRTSIDLDSSDLPFKKSFRPVLQVLSLGHALLAYVNGEYVGTAHGVKREYNFPFSVAVRLKEGLNNISVLGCTVGMPDSGSYMERRYTGIRTVELLGLGTGNLDISFNGWHHTVGMEGEKLKYFTEDGAKKVKWSTAEKGPGAPLTWYKAYFDEPDGDGPLSLRMLNMTKGMMWINGQSLGRYWSSYLSVIEEPSQDEYHLPRSFLKSKDNLLVIFDEAGGDINTVQIETVNRDSICSIIDEDWPADVWSWKRKGNEIVPEGDTPQVKASLKCPKDKVINRVEFASFGNPIGVCGFYLLGNCTSPNSVKIVEQNCLGKESCTIPVDRKLFDKDKDPCSNINPKTLAVQLRCGRKE